MKKLTSLLLSLTIVLIVSCSKKDSPPSAGATNGVSLAGAKGGTKSWSLVSISQSVNGGTAQTVTPTTGIPTCESDNVFQFSHDAGQSYQQIEGATMCATSDPSNIESGSWAFSEDGKTLFIEGSVYPTDTQFQTEDYLFYFILSVGKPWTVTQISANSFTITYSATYTDSSTNTKTTYVITLAFASKS